MSDNALIVAEERSVADVRGQVNKIQELMKDIMQKGQHYGVIPGTGSKPSLLKPGAEKLCFVFRYAAEFAFQREDFPEGHREFLVTCTLKDTAGRTVAQGVGSCSTMEKKYRFRRDGTENPNIADTYNTVLKMAKKRAHVDATITACAASDIFTQDIEDFREEEEPRNVTPPPAPRAPEPAPQQDLAREMIHGLMKDLTTTDEEFKALREEMFHLHGKDVDAVVKDLEVRQLKASHAKAKASKAPPPDEPPWTGKAPAVETEMIF